MSERGTYYGGDWYRVDELQRSLGREIGRRKKAEALLGELWANESVRAAIGEGDPAGLYARLRSYGVDV